MRIRDDCIKRPRSPVAKDFVPQGGLPYRVSDGDSWTSIARQHNIAPWKLIRFNFPDLSKDQPTATREVNWYLQENVGCRTVTADGKNYIFSSSAEPGVIYLPSAPAKKVDYGRWNVTINFMYNEMITNAKSAKVAEIRDMLTGARAARVFPIMGEPGERSARAGMVMSDTLQAALRWRDLVKSGARWDHKPKLRQMLGLSSDLHFAIQGDATHEYYYDIWSNIHFGYVGRAAGFTGSLLQWGAARGGAAGRNDPVDIETTQIGIDLWDRYGTKLTQSQLNLEILRRKQRLLMLQQTPEYRQAQSGGRDPHFRHLVPMTSLE
jgi:hypothetical protein